MKKIIMFLMILSFPIFLIPEAYYYEGINLSTSTWAEIESKATYDSNQPYENLQYSIYPSTAEVPAEHIIFSSKFSEVDRDWLAEQEGIDYLGVGIIIYQVLGGNQESTLWIDSNINRRINELNEQYNVNVSTT